MEVGQLIIEQDGLLDRMEILIGIHLQGHVFFILVQDHHVAHL